MSYFSVHSFINIIQNYSIMEEKWIYSAVLKVYFFFIIHEVVFDKHGII